MLTDFSHVLALIESVKLLAVDPEDEQSGCLPVPSPVAG